MILHLYVAPPDLTRDALTQDGPTQDDLTRDTLTQDGPTQSDSNTNQEEPLSRMRTNGLILFWAGLGKRGLWFAAGVLFARLAASRLSLLIVWLESMIQFLQQSWIWQQVTSYF